MPAELVLDPTDRKLLGLLRQNARRSVTALGKELNLSRTAVHARLARLERDGVIAGYVAVLHQPPVNGVSAVVSLRFAVRPCSLVFDRISAWPEIRHGYSTAGPIDAVLVVQLASTAALSDFADRLRAVPGVDAVETTVVLGEFTSQVKVANAASLPPAVAERDP